MEELIGTDNPFHWVTRINRNFIDASRYPEDALFLVVAAIAEMEKMKDVSIEDLPPDVRGLVLCLKDLLKTPDGDLVRAHIFREFKMRLLALEREE